MKAIKAIILSLSFVFLLASCGPKYMTKGEAFPKMYSLLPLSVLVLPPINESTAADAKEYYSTTIAEPLSLSGYYVFPIEVVSDILKNEGIYDTETLIAVPPRKFKEYFGADAVMYITIRKWDTAYYVVAGNVTVSLHFLLRSTTTGEVLWEYKGTIVEDTSVQAGGADLASLIISLVATAIKTATTDYIPVAQRTNWMVLNTIPYGKYHPKYEKDKNLKIVEIGKTHTSRFDHFEMDQQLTEMSGAKIAVLPFVSPNSDLGWQYAEEFSLLMGKLRRFDMIECMQVQKLFGEQDLDPNRIDDSTAVRIGKMLGAKGVVIGSVHDYVNVRLVNNETGLHIWNARMKLDEKETASASVRRAVSVNIVSTLSEAAIGINVINSQALSNKERRKHGVTDAEGAVVFNILPSSNAVGLLTIGDVIRAVDGLPVADKEDVILATFGKKPGQSIHLLFKRHGVSKEVDVPLIPRKF